LYPAPLRDLLMHLALSGLFRARWTARIRDEWMAALLEKRSDQTREQLEWTRNQMDAAVPDCLVDGYQHLEAGLDLPDPADRHVLAAAILCQAGTPSSPTTSSISLRERWNLMGCARNTRISSSSMPST
jgi:hypothetical protein